MKRRAYPLTPSERAQLESAGAISKSWRHSYQEWSDWAEDLLFRLGLQPESGVWGDHEARSLIESRCMRLKRKRK